MTRSTLRLVIVLILLFAAQIKQASCQSSAYSVLDMSSAARSAALGMDYLSVYSSDINVGLDNPSLLSSSFHHRAAVNYVNLFAGANFGSVAYGLHHQKIGDMIFALHFNSYGKFQGYDETETSTGSFYAADIVLSASYCFHVDSSFSLGVKLKPTLSQYESYSALVLPLDVCGSYVSPSRRFSITMMSRNMGIQLVSFSGTSQHLPYSLSMAMSYQLSNAPFRFYLAANQLQRWNLRADDPLNPVVVYDPYAGEYTQESWVHEYLDKGFRHVVAGVELAMKNVLFLRMGYNYRQSAEMTASTNLNFSGFSFGVGVHKQRFHLDYAHRNYHQGQGLNYLSLTFAL